MKLHRFAVRRATVFAIVLGAVSFVVAAAPGYHLLKKYPFAAAPGATREYFDYISVDSVAEKKGVITHFSISIDHIDQDSAKRLADKINSELPDAKAKAAFQPNDGVSTVNLIDPDGFHVQISPKDGR